MYINATKDAMELSIETFRPKFCDIASPNGWRLVNFILTMVAIELARSDGCDGWFRKRRDVCSNCVAVDPSKLDWPDDIG